MLIALYGCTFVRFALFPDSASQTRHSEQCRSSLSISEELANYQDSLHNGPQGLPVKHVFSVSSSGGEQKLWTVSMGPEGTNILSIPLSMRHHVLGWGVGERGSDTQMLNINEAVAALNSYLL
jgi:hypothetical protein